MKIKFNSKNTVFYLLAFLVAVIPVQGFLLTWARHIFDLSSFSFSVLSFWKEFILILLMIITGVNFIREKDRIFKINSSDKAVLLFFGIVFIYFVLFNLPVAQKLAGVRYEIEFLLFYFVSRLSFLDKKDLLFLLYTFLIVSVPVTIFGLLQISYLSPVFMEQFGYVKTLADFAKTGVLSTYEVVNPSLPGVYRVQSTFPGAIQFGSYLVVVLSLYLSFLAYLKGKVKYLYIVGAVISGWALYATHTRSAWIAALVALAVVGSCLVKNKKILFVSTVSIFIIGLSIVAMFFNNPKFQTILLHGEIRNGGQLYGSTAAHLEALNDNIRLVERKPLGNGVGFAGPASKIVSSPVITENWYLQVVLELGTFGLLAFVSIVIFIPLSLFKIFKKTKDNFQKYLSLGLLASFVGLSVSALFLHSFSDTATVYPMFIFIGILFSLSQKDLT